MKKEDRIIFSDMLDEVFIYKYFGVLIFISFMWVVFKFIFDVLVFFSDIIDWFFSWFGDEVGVYVVNDVLVFFFRDGIIGGFGSVLVFLLLIVFLFLVFLWLEDSGYMVRVVFVMDRVMYYFGFYGKFVILMIMGFGCNVLVIMVMRIFEDEKDRILMIFVNLLMFCLVRLLIYVVFVGVFFVGREGMVIISMYFFGIVFVFIIVWFFRKFIFKGEFFYFVMEFLLYNRFNWGIIFGIVWMRMEKFFRKVGIVIFVGVIVVWLFLVIGFSGYFGLEVFENGELFVKFWVVLFGYVL